MSIGVDSKGVARDPNPTEWGGAFVDADAGEVRSQGDLDAKKAAAGLPLPEHRVLQEELYQRDNKSQGNFQKKS